MAEEKEKKKQNLIEDGKYLTFKLMNEVYGINVDHILQIIAIPNITPIPRTPEFVKGVINLRGRIIPVVDLRLKFELEKKDYDERTSIIIIKLNFEGKTLFIGVIVDNVLEVQDIPGNAVEEKPSFGVKLDTSYIFGMAKVKKIVVTLLDIERVLTKEELVLLDDENNEKE